MKICYRYLKNTNSSSSSSSFFKAKKRSPYMLPLISFCGLIAPLSLLVMFCFEIVAALQVEEEEEEEEEEESV
jgi:hypothetical protein